MACRSLLFAACLFTTAALADDPAWMQAQGVARATGIDLAAQRNLLAIGPHVDALEKALADGATAPPPGPAPDGKALVLTDGPAETLLALAQAAKNNKATVAQVNPYPDIALYLALYYNEARRHEDALRVIAAGLKLTYSDSLGAHLPKLYSERAGAYAQLKRLDEALATDDAGLNLAADTDADKARFLRGRGYALTELNRLDEAEAAYRDSLKMEPGNPLAMRELAYVEHLKAGGTRAPGGQLTVPGKPNPDAPGAKPI